MISIHALREEGDAGHGARHGGQPISIHALREEGDPSNRRTIMQQVNFYPRPPRGGRPPLRVALAALRAISIHALREEGDMLEPWPRLRLNISIHALREEGDSCSSDSRAFLPISIHALREEGDFRSSNSRPMTLKFLSTPSARRATDHIGDLRLRGAISIHALREEGDLPP